jgi:nucleoside phosphorylase
MSGVDVLIVAALRMEFEAARAAGSSPAGGGTGVQEWVEQDPDGSTPYLLGEWVERGGARMTVALARSTRTGSRWTAPVASGLAQRLGPRCVAMCGVCAGNPAVVALGDVIVAENTYGWDEGQLTIHEFKTDPQPSPLDERWVRAARCLSTSGLPSNGPANDDEATAWFLHRLLAGQDPRVHPARERYLPGDRWATLTARMQAADQIERRGASWTLTDHGRASIKRIHDDVRGPRCLPFTVVVGPVVTGSAVVRDGATWDRLESQGAGSVAGLDMEAAAVAASAFRQRIPHWLVVKGVMDHADPAKDDRYKRFAAQASAEVLYSLLGQLVADRSAPATAAPQRRRNAGWVGSIAPAAWR